MSECAQIIAVLKRSLEGTGTTYRDLAAKSGLSERRSNASFPRKRSRWRAWSRSARRWD